MKYHYDANYPLCASGFRFKVETKEDEKFLEWLSKVIQNSSNSEYTKGLNCVVLEASPLHKDAHEGIYMDMKVDSTNFKIDKDFEIPITFGRYNWKSKIILKKINIKFINILYFYKLCK